MPNKYFENLDFSHLKNKLIFLDIDGTIASDSKSDINPAVLKNIRILDQNNKVFLCTNSFHKDRAHDIAKITDLKFIDCKYKKPFKKILDFVDQDLLSLEKIVIGDKFLTEGLFAANINAEFIKVKRKVNSDSSIIKLINLIDDLIYSLIKLF